MILKSKTYIKLLPFWIFAQKTTFAWIDFPILLVCHSRDLSATKTEVKPSVAICGGSFCILTGLQGEVILLYIATWPQCHKSNLRLNAIVSVKCVWHALLIYVIYFISESFSNTNLEHSWFQVSSLLSWPLAPNWTSMYWLCAATIGYSSYVHNIIETFNFAQYFWYYFGIMPIDYVSSRDILERLDIHSALWLLSVQKNKTYSCIAPWHHIECIDFNCHYAYTYSS
jgi:hypothetical protein